MYNTQYYKRLPPAYSTKLRVTQKPSHQCEGELPSLPVTSCCHAKPPACQRLSTATTVPSTGCSHTPEGGW